MRSTLIGLTLAATFLAACGGEDEPAPASTVCGASGQSCCNGGACNSGLSCSNGTCQGASTSCGASGQSCCNGGACNSGLSCSNGTCQGGSSSCGASGQACCAGDQCNSGLSCSGGRCAAAATTKDGDVCQDTTVCTDSKFLCVVRSQGDVAGTCRLSCTSWANCTQAGLAFYKCCPLGNLTTSVCIPDNLIPEDVECD